MSKELYVRIVAHKKDEMDVFWHGSWFFKQDWQRIVIDNDDMAVLAGLYAAQMLEVSENKPVDFIEPTSEGKDADASGSKKAEVKKQETKLA